MKIKCLSTPTVKDLINNITIPIRKASFSEKNALSRALGIRSLRDLPTQFESHGGDIIGGEMFPNISVTTKGVSPMATMGNIINVELARIRGQLKKVSLDDLKL